MSVDRLRRRREIDLEAELRAGRPVPSAELVRSIVGRAENATRTVGGGFRVAFAGALTAAMLAALAGFGGVGYAAVAVDGAAKAVKKTLSLEKSPVLAHHKPGHTTPAQSQYGKKCGHTPATDTPPRDKGSTKPAPGTPPGNPNNNTCPGTSGPKK